MYKSDQDRSTAKVEKCDAQNTRLDDFGRVEIKNSDFLFEELALLLDAFIHAKELEKAQKLVSSLSRSFKDHWPIKLQITRLEIEHCRFELAAQLSKELLESLPDDTSASGLYILSLTRLGRYPELLDYIEHAPPSALQAEWAISSFALDYRFRSDADEDRMFGAIRKIADAMGDAALLWSVKLKRLAGYIEDARKELSSMGHHSNFDSILKTEYESCQAMRAPTAKTGLFRGFAQAQALPLVQEPVFIIVPIFNAFEDVCECLGRLHRYTAFEHIVILIDDASTDQRISHLCAEFVAKRPSSKFIKQSTNQGFVHTVNRGLKEALGHVVILNTDAFVPEGWLERLISPILEDPRVSSVTPMTNNGEIANVPLICKPENLHPGVADKIDIVARQFDPINTLTEIPTGVGFCMAMSKEWINKIPSFDISFGRGYGEEVDWCQQAIQLGGKHMLTGALFVEHRGGMSFGADKEVLITNNNQLIQQRYSDYDFRVQRFISEDPAIGQRLALGLVMIGLEGEIPVFFAHRLGGGAEIWLQSVIVSRIRRQQSSVVIREGDINGTLWLELHTSNGVTQSNIQLDELSEYIKMLPMKEIVYSCLVASKSPFNLINSLVKHMTSHDRFRIQFHDFFPLCPSYNLMSDQDRYCELPISSVCEGCYQNIKDKTGNLSKTISEWRSNWLSLIERAYKIEVFSESSKKILLQVWPQLEHKINVKPHQLNTPSRKVNSTKNLVPVMGVLGSIVYSKGAQVLHEIARTAGDRLKIVIIGELDSSYSHEKLSEHGRYSRDQISDLAKGYSIDFWFLPSIWPETFSYTTHECIATELPVFAFDIGAQGDTVRSYSKGIVLPPSISTTELIDKLCNFKHFVQKADAG